MEIPLQEKNIPTRQVFAKLQATDQVNFNQIEIFTDFWEADKIKFELFVIKSQDFSRNQLVYTQWVFWESTSVFMRVFVKHDAANGANLSEIKTLANFWETVKLRSDKCEQNCPVFQETNPNSNIFIGIKLNISANVCKSSIPKSRKSQPNLLIFEKLLKFNWKYLEWKTYYFLRIKTLTQKLVLGSTSIFMWIFQKREAAHQPNLNQIDKPTDFWETA